MLKRLFWIIIVIILVAAVLKIVFSKKGPRTAMGAEAITVEVMPASKGDIKKTCEILGTIMADKTAQVFPETMGRVTRIIAREGTYIPKDGAIIALKNETIGFEFEEGFIRSPINGNVAKIMVDIGSMVTPQTPVALVVDYARVRVDFNVSENDVGCMTTNRAASVEIDALPNQPFNGYISEISPVVDPMTRTINIKAVVNNPKKILKPGMTARVTVNLGEKNNVLVVPNDALLDHYVFVAKDTVAERRDVTPGLVGDKKTEILNGIAENEWIIVVGQERLAGGEKIKAILRTENEHN